MDIAEKLKAARQRTGLTQEQAAEQLQVSRQTISNWENGRTYPDIASVLRMSDVYSVSLDHLLKEGSPDYTRYLEQSADTVRIRKKLAWMMLGCIYLSIWAFSLVTFWFLTDGSDAMGYSLVHLWVLLPVTTFVTSLLIGKIGDKGPGIWFLPLGFGVLYMLSHYGTFGAANMAAFGKFTSPEWGMLPAGALISLLGIAIGAAFQARAGKRRAEAKD